MLFGINQNHADALFTQNGGQHGTGKTVAENRDVEIVFRFLHDHRIILRS